MAEEKPKGEPVFLKIPTTGETITLPGVTSLSSNDELKAAADAWIAKNYKGPLLAAPVVARLPVTGESAVIANRQPELKAATPTFTENLYDAITSGVANVAGVLPGFDERGAAQYGRDVVRNFETLLGMQTEMKTADEQSGLKAYSPDTITTGIYDALASGVANVAGLLPGFDEREAAIYGQDVVSNIESLLGLQATERSLSNIAKRRGTGGDYLTAGLTLAPFAAKPIASGFRRVAPEFSAAAGRFATGPVAVADEIAAAVPETALTPEMAAVVRPVAPAPVVPETLVKAKPVELPEAPVAAAAIPEAAIPEAAVAPTPTPEIAPAITPERVGEMRASAEDVIKGMAAGTPEAPVPERIGTLKSSNFQTPDETKRFLSDVAKANKDFPEARRGTMTIEQINELSKDVNLKDILGRKISMPLNAEQIQAAKSVVYQNTEDAVAKAKAWVASGGQDPVAFQEAVDSLVSNTAFLETLQGASSELGRAMRVLRERPSVDLSIAMKQLLEQRAKGVSTEELIQSLATFDDPASAAKFVGKIATPTWKDKFKEYYINFWLSGIKTQTINLASNVLTAVSPLIEKPLEAGIGALRRTPDRVTFREVGARVAGMRQGTREGLKLAAQAFKTGEAQSRVTRLDVQRNAIGGPVGEVVRIPTRLLLTQDEFFKSIARRGELNAQAFKKAFDESGGNKQKLDELFTKYKEEPTEAMQKAAEREAEYRTFQSELGQTGKNFQRFLAQSPTASFFIPFFKSPANLLKYAAERSPLAPLSDRWMTEIKAGGRQRDEALAKLSLGIGATGALVSYALEGKITGSGPTDPKERAALLATGWQPYSIKVGDTYYSIGKLDPYATLFGVVADAVTAKDYMTQEEYEKALAFIPFSIASNIAQKTYLQGFTNLYESLAGDYADITTVEKFIRDTAAGLAVPNLFRQAGAAIDPQVREANSIIKEVQNRIPVIRGNTFTIAGTDYDINRVPNKLNVWGDPITRTGALPVAGRPTIDQVGAISFNLLSPVGMSTTTKDPFLKEIGRLQLGVAPPKKEVSLSINVEGREKPVKFKIELTDQERRQFTFTSGKLGKALIQADMASPEWKELDDDERRAKIKKRMEFSRSAFRTTFGVMALKRYAKENKKLPPVQP